MEIIEKMKEKSPEMENILFRTSTKLAFVKALPFCALPVAFLLLALKLHPIFIWPSVEMVILAGYKFISVRSKTYRINNEFIKIDTGILFEHSLTIYFSTLEGYRARQDLMMLFYGYTYVQDAIVTSDEFERMLLRIPLNDLVIVSEW